jgi:hypothetical protein
MHAETRDGGLDRTVQSSGSFLPTASFHWRRRAPLTRAWAVRSGFVIRQLVESLIAASCLLRYTALRFASSRASFISKNSRFRAVSCRFAKSRLA